LARIFAERKQTGETDLEAAGIEASRRVLQRYPWSKVFERMFDIYRQIRI